MAKVFITLGYLTTVETEPGVWEESFAEHEYFGELTRLPSSRWQNSQSSTNDNIVIRNSLSVIMDPFAYDNYSLIRYANIDGVKWRVSSVEVDRPRLHLSLEDVFNA